MIGLGIEDVPKLHEHENGEEQRQLLRRKLTTYMMEVEITDKIITEGKVGHGVHATMHKILDETEQHRHKQNTNAKNATSHILSDNEGIARARLVVQHAMVGRQRGQSHGRKGIHDEVNPQHLRHGKWRRSTHHRT